MGQPAAPGTRSWLRRASAWPLAALVGAVALSGCGSSDEPAADAGSAPASEPVAWTLVLDYQPNAVHAGLLHAQAAGYFERAGIDLEIVAPASTSDPLTQVSRGKADLGLADLIDVARRNDRDASLVLTGAVVQRPMSGILVDAASNITRPQQLRGKRIAVTGLPSDEAVVEAIVSSGAGPKIAPDTVTLGFNGLKALDAGRVDGATAYWPADAVSLEDLGTKPRVFALDEFGGPRYPGLVAFTGSKLAAQEPAKLDAFQDALARGTREVAADPVLGRRAVGDAYPELDAAITARQLRAIVPLFGTGEQAGRIDPATLTAFAQFAAESNLTSRTLSPAELGLRER